MRFHRHSLRSLLALGAFAGAAFVGCGRPEATPTPTPSTSATPKPETTVTMPAAKTPFKPPTGAFKVGLVMSGSTSDGGWNAGALKAFQAIKSELKLSDADAAFIDKQSAPGDQEKSLRA
ncbi:MAG: hypothetical protein JWN14_5186, partial [Chthonomonadales bacterium]|nr:hypothetical protein [Chthonomonadales bacterium]